MRYIPELFSNTFRGSMIYSKCVVCDYTKQTTHSVYCLRERNSTIAKLVLIAGDHGMLVTRLVEGRRAGRYALAYRFHGVWRFVTDVDTDELLTWKTEEEALIIGDAWRYAWETIKLPAPERSKHAR